MVAEPRNSTHVAKNRRRTSTTSESASCGAEGSHYILVAVNSCQTVISKRLLKERSLERDGSRNSFPLCKQSQIRCRVIGVDSSAVFLSQETHNLLL